MNIDLLISVLNKSNSVFITRDDILCSCRQVFPDFKITQLRFYIEKLLNNKNITRVGRNKYIVTKDDQKRKNYSPELSEKSKNIRKIIKEEYPLVNFCIWDFSILNEFLNHLVAHNHIFLEVDKDTSYFIYESLLNNNYISLFNPTEKDLQLYSADNDIILINLISGAPINCESENTISLEKLIVDMFSNKILRQMISSGDYVLTLEDMFSKYIINQDRLFRYAARRNRDEIIYNFIKNNTNIKLLEERKFDK